MYYGFGLWALGFGRWALGVGSWLGACDGRAMRDFRKLRTFQLADSLVVDVYRATRPFPAEERYGMQSQIRRAAVSVPSNIVEGSARRTQGEYVQFLHVAIGSAIECAYLCGVSVKLGFLAAATGRALTSAYDELARRLQCQVEALGSPSHLPEPGSRSHRPRAQSPEPRA
jgi:four helix bundle protein